MTDANGVNERFTLLREGYVPTEAEASAWNVAGTIDAMRHLVTEPDAAWLLPAVAGNDGPRAALYLALLQPLATKPEVRDLLTRRFETASPYLKSQLFWRLLDDKDLPVAVHETLFRFVLSDWREFQEASVSFLGSPSGIINGALGRLAECIPSKRWAYLCCLPGYATDQRAVKGLLTVAAGSADAFTATVARSLLERFF